MAIRILTDSTSDITQEQARALNLEVIPLRVIFGEESYRDGVDLTHEQFYQRLRESPRTPTTSQPAPEDFLESFLEAKRAGEPIIAILLAQPISGTVQSAAIARELADYSDIFIVNSNTTAIGLRLLVELALRLRNEGCSAAGIVDVLEQSKERVVLFAMLDTLDYLYRGGRLSKTGHIAGSILRFKPVITLRDGALSVVTKARGTANGIRSLLDEVARTGGIDRLAPVYFGYTDTEETCLLLRRQAKERFAPSSEVVGPIGAVVGTHAGPGACAIAYLRRE